MAATQDVIRGWLMRGKLDRDTHMIVVCDAFNWTDRPVYVRPDQDVQSRIDEEKAKSMQRVMEVYNLALPFDPQLQEKRVWNL